MTNGGEGVGRRAYDSNAGCSSRRLLHTRFHVEVKTVDTCALFRAVSVMKMKRIKQKVAQGTG